MARILYALSGQGRGHTSRVLAVSEALQARGHEVHFACGGQAREILTAQGHSVLAVPALLLAIAIVTVLGKGLLNAQLAVAIVAIPIYAIIRIGAFAGMNRPETLSTIPAAAGHFEWGASLYITYAF